MQFPSTSFTRLTLPAFGVCRRPSRCNLQQIRAAEGAIAFNARLAPARGLVDRLVPFNLPVIRNCHARSFAKPNSVPTYLRPLKHAASRSNTLLPVRMYVHACADRRLCRRGLERRRTPQSARRRAGSVASFCDPGAAARLISLGLPVHYTFSAMRYACVGRAQLEAATQRVGFSDCGGLSWLGSISFVGFTSAKSMSVDRNVSLREHTLAKTMASETTTAAGTSTGRAVVGCRLKQVSLVINM